MNATATNASTNRAGWSMSLTSLFERVCSTLQIARQVDRHRSVQILVWVDCKDGLLRYRLDSALQPDALTSACAEIPFDASTSTIQHAIANALSTLDTCYRSCLPTDPSLCQPPCETPVTGGLLVLSCCLYQAPH